jgi:hypothetical protein
MGQKRTLLLVLGMALLAVYIVAKIDFFTHYRILGPSSYFRHHAIYWAVMAGLALFIWRLEKL